MHPFAIDSAPPQAESPAWRCICSTNKNACLVVLSCCFDLENVQNNVEDQVSVRPYTNTGELADYRVRLDAIGSDDAGNMKLTDFKSSDTAGFTPNQRTGYPLLAKYGGVVVGNSGGESYPAGTVIPPTKVDVIRPGIIP
jgi:hypothetical protein